MYVETDFLLALAKEEDWLKAEAEAALDEYDDLETSLLPFLELSIISDEFEFDRTRAVADLLDLLTIVPQDDKQIVLKAARYQDEEDATAFDAYNAAIAETRGDTVLGSDSIYDDLGIPRLPLEPDDNED